MIEISKKKIVAVLFTVLFIAFFAWYSARPKYIIVYAESSLQESSYTIPDPKSIDEDIIVYQETDAGLRVVASYITKSAYQKKDLYQFDNPSSTIKHIVERKRWQPVDSTVYNNLKTMKFSKGSDTLTVFIKNKENTIKRIEISHNYSKNIENDYIKTMENFGEFAYKEEEFKVYKLGVYQGALAKVGNKLIYEIQLSE